MRNPNNTEYDPTGMPIRKPETPYSPQSPSGDRFDAMCSFYENAGLNLCGPGRHIESYTECTGEMRCLRPEFRTGYPHCTKSNPTGDPYQPVENYVAGLGYNIFKDESCKCTAPTQTFLR